MLIAVLALVLGARRLVGLTALGRALLGRRRAPALSIPLALLAAGAGLGAMYSVLLWAGWRDFALALDLSASAGAAILRGRRTATEFRQLFGPLFEVVRRRRWILATTSAVCAVYCFNAAMPPRDTDALRYHLAHIGQIDRDGQWSSIAIAHYAFPFAWQFTFLPFVHWHLAEATQVVNLGLGLIALAALVAHRGGAAIGRSGVLFLAVVALSPLMIATATTSTADAFTVLSAVVVTLLLSERAADHGSVGFGDATALGFAAWVAIGTRYQAIAIGIAATLIAVLWLARSDRWVALLGFVEGSVLALLLAAPFYLANAVRFGNLIWPLHSTGSDPADYRAAVGAYFSASWHGVLDATAVGQSLGRLLIDRSAAPVPLLLAMGIAGAYVTRRSDTSARRVAGFALIFVGTWLLAQPMLYPRFAVYLIGPAVLLGLNLAEKVGNGRRAAVASVVLGITLIPLGAYAGAGIALDLRALHSGGREALRASTWYYPVYAWIGNNTDRDARVLVVVRSGESFFLDRPYRRADPASSAEVDWPRIRDGAALASRLRSGRFDYVIFEPLGAAAGPGGPTMVRAVNDAAARGELAEVQRFDLRLSRSRFRAASFSSTVIVYRVAAANRQPDRP